MGPRVHQVFCYRRHQAQRRPPQVHQVGLTNTWTTPIILRSRRAHQVHHQPTLLVAIAQPTVIDILAAMRVVTKQFMKPWPMPRLPVTSAVVVAIPLLVGINVDSGGIGRFATDLFFRFPMTARLPTCKLLAHRVIQSVSAHPTTTAIHGSQCPAYRSAATYKPIRVARHPRWAFKGQ